MDVRPVGSGPTGTGLTQGAGAASPVGKVNAAKPPEAGGVAPALDAALLSALSESDVARLTAILEPRFQSATQASELFQAVLTAAAEGVAEQALAGLTQLAQLDPARAEAIRTEPVVEPLRAQVDSLLARLANVAKLDAQSRIALATRIVEEGRGNALPDWEAAPHTLLLIANRLLDAGGYVNSAHATQIAQVIVDSFHWAPAAAPVSLPRAEKPADPEEPRSGVVIAAFRQTWRVLGANAPRRVARLWRRAPLLVLLLTWLVLGTAGGLASRVQRALWPTPWPSWLTDAGFTLWAIGFLALVAFGFYLRVRNVRF